MSSKQQLLRSVATMQFLQKTVGTSIRSFSTKPPVSTPLSLEDMLAGSISQKKKNPTSTSSSTSSSTSTTSTSTSTLGSHSVSHSPTKVSHDELKAKAEATRRILERKFTPKTVDELVPKLPKGSYVEHKDRPKSQREKDDKKVKDTEKILWVIVALSIVYGVYTLRPDYARMKRHLAKDEKGLVEFPTEHISTIHISEA